MKNKNYHGRLVETDRQEKERLWKKKVEEVRTWKDVPGTEMDEGIIETVVAFNLNGLTTFSSCEGHEVNYTFPHVDLVLPQQPIETFINERKIIKHVAEKFNFPVEEYWEALVGKDTKTLSTLGNQFGNLYHGKIIKEASIIYRKNEKTNERKEWEKGVRVVTKKAQILLDEFYRNRELDPEIGLTILSLSSQVMSAITYNNPDVQLLTLDQEWESKYSDDEKKALQEKIARSRLEMQAFGLFLKNKFLDKNTNRKPSH